MQPRKFLQILMGIINMKTSNSQFEEERPQLARRRAAWMSDYEVTGIEDPITHFALFLEFDPTTLQC